MNKLLHELKKVSGRLLFPLLIPSRKTHTDKILILKNDSVGDFLLFSGILNFHIKHFGDGVYCLVNNNLEDMAKLYTNNVIVIDKNRYFASISYRHRLLKQLNDIGFGMAINSILNSSESRDILQILKIPKTYLYEGSLSKLKDYNFWRKRADIIPSFKIFDDKGMYINILNHEMHYMEKILNLKVSDDDIKPHIPLKDVVSETLINKFSLHKGKYIVFSLSSGDPKRNYPIKEFIEVIKHFHNKLNTKAVLIGLDQYDLEDRLNNLSAFVVDLRRKTSLIEDFAIIKHARFFIGNETGITHASWIMGVLTVMIYGGGQFGRFHPIYKNGYIVNKYMDCYYCNWNCRYDDTPVPCIKNISASDIIKLSEEILS
ncbi:MAG: glycosyltransferase family 9 protein [Nitrospinae bacterium]|nr:glycosyltransferase family 9 protein [Nitrospinota bacterium]